MCNAAALSGGWYGCTVAADIDAGWPRRFTGHLETPAASVAG